MNSLTGIHSAGINGDLGHMGRAVLKIVVAAVQPAFRQQVGKILDGPMFDKAGEAVDGVEAVDAVVKAHADILVLDLNIPPTNGLYVAREIARLGLNTRVVILSRFEDRASVIESFRAGIRACVHKSHVTTDLIPAIQKVERGRLYLSPVLTDLMVTPYPHQLKLDPGPLNHVETKVLQSMVQDTPVKEIARQLSLSDSALELHRGDIMRELQISNIGGLIRHAVRHSLVRM